MAIVGNQSVLRRGARVYFKRDASGGVEFPGLNIGTITEISETKTVNTVEARDPFGGANRLVLKEVTDITEEFSITTINMSLANQSLAALGGQVQTLSQSATERSVVNRIVPGGVHSLHEADSGKTPISGVQVITGIYTGAIATKGLPTTGTVVNASTKTIKITGDQTALAALAPGKAFFLNGAGLANKKNAQTYTVVSRALNGGNTDLVVSETIASDETAITGATITHAGAGGSDLVLKIGTDWGIDYLEGGHIKVYSAGAVTAPADYTIVFTPIALTGKRIVFPQAGGDALTGEFRVEWSGGNFQDRQTRSFRGTILPSGGSASGNEFATLQFTISVLSDPSSTSAPAGRLVDHSPNIAPEV